MHARENQTETPTAELKFLSHLRRRQKMDVFFFSGALGHEPGSGMAERHQTILNRAGVQWLCRATPVGGLTRAELLKEWLALTIG